MDKNSSLGMPMSPQEIFKRYKRQSLGMPRSIPFFINKVSGHLSMRYIFIASYDMCYSWSVFVFIFSLLCFVYCNKQLDLSILMWERDTLRFNCIEHSSFHSYCSTSVLFLRVLRLALVFHPYYVLNFLVLFSQELSAL